MQPNQWHCVAPLRADHQRHMLAHVIAGAECHDFGRIAGLNWQPCAGLDGQLQRVFERGEIGGGDMDSRFDAGQDHECWQNSCQPRQIERSDGCSLRLKRIGAEWPAQRLGQIERRIGERTRGVERKGIRAVDHHRGFGRSGLALVGEFERCGACGGD